MRRLPHRGRRAPLQPAVGGANAHRRQPAQLLDRVGPLRRDLLLRAQQHRRLRDDLVRMVAGEPVSAEMENYAASSMSLTTKGEIFSAMVVALSGGTALDMKTNTHDSFVNEW